MSLLKSLELTPEKVAANRANAQRSTGPATAAGQAQSKRNALKHGQSARQLPSRALMAALGEDPGEYERLSQRLLGVWAPGDALAAQQVEDLARLYWRRDRVERAQEALLEQALERFETEQASLRRQFEEGELSPQQELWRQPAGLYYLSDCPGKFRRCRELFRTLLAAVEQGDWREELPALAEALYGPEPLGTGEMIRYWVRRLTRPPGADPAEAPAREKGRQDLLRFLREQWADLEAEAEKFRKEHAEALTASPDTVLAPQGKPWELLWRQQNALDRAIDRKVRILMALRREARTGAQATASTPDPGSSPPPGDASPPGAEGREQESEVRSQETGVRRQEIGVRSQEAGLRFQGPGVGARRCLAPHEGDAPRHPYGVRGANFLTNEATMLLKTKNVCQRPYKRSHHLTENKGKCLFVGFSPDTKSFSAARRTRGVGFRAFMPAGGTRVCLDAQEIPEPVILKTLS